MRNRKSGTQYTFGSQDPAKRSFSQKLRIMGDGTSGRGNAPRDEGADLERLAERDESGTLVPLDEIFR